MRRFLTTWLLVCACGAEPEGRPRTWSYIHAAVIQPNCATSSCHGPLAATAGIVLYDRDAALSALLDLQLVVPGDDQSALLALLEGRGRVRMPPDAPLPAGDVGLVRAWIAEGAPP